MTYQKKRCSNMTFKMKLKAKNSSGEQTLYIEPFHEDLDEAVAITLHGEYEGEEIQIDFDEVPRKQFKENLKTLIEAIEEVERNGVH